MSPWPRLVGRYVHFIWPDRGWAGGRVMDVVYGGPDLIEAKVLPTSKKRALWIPAADVRFVVLSTLFGELCLSLSEWRKGDSAQRGDGR